MPASRSRIYRRPPSGSPTRRQRSDLMDAMDMVKASHIRSLLASGTREDGRDFFSFRDIKVTAGLLDNAEGSAQVRIGNTTVLAGVKLDLGEPMTDTPNQGNQIVSAELLPLASEAYETGP